MRLNYLVRVLPFALFLMFCSVGCGQPKLSSHWRGHEVTIDGADGDWKDSRVYIESAGVTVGVLNDSESLYLTLSVIERRFQVQVLRQGFIIWFDRKGGKRKNFGVRFPLGMPELLMKDREGGFGAEGYGRPGRYDGAGGPGGRGRYGNPAGFERPQEMGPERVEELFDQLMEGAEMEILGANPNDRIRVPLATSEEILMQVDYTNGRLIYELKVPLARVARLDKKDKPIGVGFEIPEVDFRALLQAREARGTEGELSGGRAGGLGGAGGLSAGRGGYGTRRRRSENIPTESYQLWTKVSLAREDGL
jgi:hypothetical protein